MKKLLFLCLLASVMLFAACGDSNNEATPETPNQAGAYIEGSIIRFFFEPDTLRVVFLSPSQDNDNTSLWIRAISSFETAKITENHWYKSSEKGQKYIEYYGDTTYPKSFHSYSRNEYKVSAMPLESINITADKDFDSEHPAGASLNDLFVLQFSSAYNVIKSNYDSKLDMTYYYRNHPEDAFEIMPLSEFKTLNLLYFESYLYFNKLPEKLGTYEFTITFNYGKDPISGREVKVAPAVVKAEFTEKDYVVPLNQ